MEFEYSKKTKMYMEQLTDFMNKYIYPNEEVFHEQLDAGADRWQVPPIMEELKAKARERGLWNLFLPESERGAGLTNLEYAPLCEIMGRSPIAAEAFNCSAPDTGNMEVIERYGTPEQKKQWLEPLLEGKIRSAFAMTEPKVASSDATNIESSIVRDGDHYVINGHKWWTLGHRRPALQDPHLHGQDRPEEPRPLQAAVDDPGAARHAGHQGAPHADRVRLRRRAPRPRRGAVRERPRAGLQHAARRGPRLRDRPGPPRARPHPPLHAPDRRGRAGARAHVQALA